MVSRSDILIDKPHSRFDTKILSEKVQLKHWYLWYLSDWNNMISCYFSIEILYSKW